MAEANSCCLIGLAKVVGSSPLGVDLTRAVESMEHDRPGVFGSGGAYAQVFALFTSASAGGVLAGPAWTSFAYGKINWTLLVSSLGLFSASVAIPVVGSSEARSYMMILELTRDGVAALILRSQKTTPRQYSRSECVKIGDHPLKQAHFPTRNARYTKLSELADFSTL